METERAISKKIDMEVSGAVNLTATSYVIHNMFELKKKCWMDGAIALLQPQSPPDELEGRDVATDIRSAFKTFFMSQDG